MKISPLSCLIGFLGLAGTAAAQVVFTVHATANGDALGYLEGQSYSFTFTLNNSFGNSGSSVFNATRNSWQEEFIADGPLWLDVDGGGLGGGYSLSDNAEDAPSAMLRVNDPGEFILSVGTNAFLGNIGLTAPDASDVAGIEFVLLIDTTGFAFPGSYSAPGGYFAGLEGTHPATGVGTARVFGPVVFSGSQAEFTFTSLTISAAAIPEPSSAAVLAGLGACALVNTRRRRVA